MKYVYIQIILGVLVLCRTTSSSTKEVSLPAEFFGPSKFPKIAYKFLPNTAKLEKLFSSISYDTQELSAHAIKTSSLNSNKISICLPKNATVTDFLRFSFQQQDLGMLYVLNPEAIPTLIRDTTKFINEKEKITKYVTAVVSIEELKNILITNFKFDKRDGSIVRCNKPNRKCTSFHKEAFDLISNRAMKKVPIKVYLPANISLSQFIYNALKKMPRSNWENSKDEILDLVFSKLLKYSEKNAVSYLLNDLCEELKKYMGSTAHYFHGNHHFYRVYVELRFPYELWLGDIIQSTILYYDFLSFHKNFHMSVNIGSKSSSGYFYACLCYYGSLVEFQNAYRDKVSQSAGFNLIEIDKGDFDKLAVEEFKISTLNYKVEFSPLAFLSLDSPFYLKSGSVFVENFPYIESQSAYSNIELIKRYAEFVVQRLNAYEYEDPLSKFTDKIRASFGDVFWKQETVDAYQIYLETNNEKPEIGLEVLPLQEAFTVIFNCSEQPYHCFKTDTFQGNFLGQYYSDEIYLRVIIFVTTIIFTIIALIFLTDKQKAKQQPLNEKKMQQNDPLY